MLIFDLNIQFRVLTKANFQEFITLTQPTANAFRKESFRTSSQP